MINNLIYIICFFICFLIYLLYEFVMKVYFFEKINLNFTFTDVGNFIFKLVVLNESNQTIHSSLDFSSNFKHYKIKNF